MPRANSDEDVDAEPCIDVADGLREMIESVYNLPADRAEDAYMREVLSWNNAKKLG